MQPPRPLTKRKTGAPIHDRQYNLPPAVAVEQLEQVAVRRVRQYIPAPNSGPVVHTALYYLLDCDSRVHAPADAKVCGSVPKAEVALEVSAQVPLIVVRLRSDICRREKQQQEYAADDLGYGNHDVSHVVSPNGQPDAFTATNSTAGTP